MPSAKVLDRVSRFQGVREAVGRSSVADRIAALAVVAVVACNLWVLRAERLDVATPNDLNVHVAMVDWATDQFVAGRVPFDGWFPVSSLGAARFHQYQSLPHLVTAAVQAATGLRGLVGWSLYLLLALWPIAVYASARLFGIGHRQASFAAVLSPLLGGLTSRGFQWESFVFSGTGLWTMAWGMWLLPFAWATSWRAVSGRGSIPVASVVLGILIPTHLLVGYLAVLCVPVWLLIEPRAFRQRALRVVLLGLGTFAVAAWFLIPFLSNRAYIPHASIYEGKAQFDSFGWVLLAKLATGLIFDVAGRAPFVTALVGWGLWRAILRARDDATSRGLLAVFALSLLLLLGRPVLGPLVDLIPGGEDLFLNRFIIGVHMAGLFLAGIGSESFTGAPPAQPRRTSASMGIERLSPVIVSVLVSAAILGMFGERVAYAEQDASRIRASIAERTAQDDPVGTLLSLADGPGRIYTGFSSATLEVWERTDEGVAEVGRFAGVDVNHQVARTGRDLLGFPRPAWSLMSVQEGFFDDGDVGNYQLFGVRYALLPDPEAPKVPADLIDRRAGLGLWEIEGAPSYLRVVQTQGPAISADRNTLATRGSNVLYGSGPRDGVYVPVAFAGTEAANPTGVDPDFSGEVLDIEAIPEDGRFSGTVRASSPAVVVLSASFDPRWTATVDGREEPVQMLAPALPGVRIDPGEHRVSFVYRPIGGYWLRILLGAILLVGVGYAARRFGAAVPSPVPEEDTRPAADGGRPSGGPDGKRSKKRRRR